jgi:O-antigen biosynthesis protein
VRYFLEHCIISVQAALQQCSGEIIVVDNNSSDGSVALIKDKYPHVICIDNNYNAGFAKANNQALAIAKGKYILFLNPDTILPENCLKNCIDYLNLNSHVGALGARLIDGKGQFLPESKRGFPNFSTAFYKISGLSSLFKKSKVFNQYHLGFLPEKEINEVDVLAGCFMMMPNTLAKELGGFSEDYFMYGEDIDLSYCVQKAGYKNVYFASTDIIHYKGESTKKGSLNYVKMFYKAMIIFAQKHLSPGSQKTFIPLIKIGIVARAFLSVINKALQSLLLPICDALIMSMSLLAVKNYWIKYIKTDTLYPNTTVITFFCIYICIWLLSIFLNGGYDKPLRKLFIIRGLIIGTIATLALYGLLPESLRFSRGITVIGAAVSAIIIWLLRFALQSFGLLESTAQKNNSIIAISAENESKEIFNLLQNAGVQKDWVGYITTEGSANKTNELGHISNLQNIIKTLKPAEIIFAYPSLSFKKIIETIQLLGSQYNFKIHAQGTESIIGSNSKNTAGDLYAADWHFAIATPAGKRNKRTFDITSSIIILITYPILFWHYPKNIVANVFNVLLGKKTWMSYDASLNYLPVQKPHVFDIYDSNSGINNHLIATQYAREYHNALDWKMLWQKIFLK